MEAPSAFYREPVPDISQGDIFASVPHLMLRRPLRAIREQDTKWGKRLVAYDYPLDVDEEERLKLPAPPGGLHFRRTEGEEAAVAFAQVTRGMMLTYDCDIENDPKHRLIALVRPLGAVRPDGQATIRDNLNFNFCYLPHEGALEESYVDFRRLTTVAPAFIDQTERLASLTLEALLYVQSRFFFFLTRRELRPEALAQLTQHIEPAQ